jgi:hypothetical protein
VYDIFVIVARACEFYFTVVPFALVGGGVDVVDAMDVIGEV